MILGVRHRLLRFDTLLVSRSAMPGRFTSCEDRQSSGSARVNSSSVIYLTVTNSSVRCNMTMISIMLIFGVRVVAFLSNLLFHADAWRI